MPVGRDQVINILESILACIAAGANISEFSHWRPDENSFNLQVTLKTSKEIRRKAQELLEEGPSSSREQVRDFLNEYMASHDWMIPHPPVTDFPRIHPFVKKLRMFIETARIARAVVESDVDWQTKYDVMLGPLLASIDETGIPMGWNIKSKPYDDSVKILHKIETRAALLEKILAEIERQETERIREKIS